MNAKDEFIRLYNENIHREGADKLLEYLLSDKSDFFIAPASTKYHGSYDNGLCIHSIDVFCNLFDYLTRTRCQTIYGMSYSDESKGIVSLLHDVCKINCYKKYMRNVKNDAGQWEQVAAFNFDDPDPFGHGEKSVFLISKFMKLTNEEAFAIRYHMGFSGDDNPGNVGKVFAKYPLAFALHVADMEASYYVDDEQEMEFKIV